MRAPAAQLRSLRLREPKAPRRSGTLDRDGTPAAGGPSWKPLPILFTVPFSLLGDDLAPYLWVWIARAGGILGCVMAYRIARRLIGGGWYGTIAGVAAGGGPRSD